MKKYPGLFLIILIAAFFFTACDKKSEEAAFANLTIQQNKEKIQEDGLATIEKMNGMSDLTGVFAMQDLVNLLNTSDLTGDPINVAVNKILAPFSHLDKNVLGLAQLRSTQVDIQTISDVMIQAGGVYTYNRNTEAFDRVANTSKIEFLYPIGFSTTNNGKLSFSNLTSRVSGNVGINGELPKSLDIALTKNNLSIFSFKFAAAYNADNIPTSWNTTMSFVEGYIFTQSMLNTEAVASWEFAYTLNNENLLSGKFNMKGAFSYDVLNNTANLDEKDWIDQLMDNANAYIQLGNLKVTGIVDVQKGMDAYDAAFPNGETGSEADVDKICNLLNQNIILVALYAKEGTVIAKSKFFKNEYTYWDYDYSTGRSYETTGFEPSLQLIFKDGSAMDDSFFDQGFDNLKAAFQDMVNGFLSSYSE